MGTRETDVLVVGGGPVGLTAALALADAGADVTVVDDEARGSLHSYALALHPSSIDLLGRLGLERSLLDAGRRISGVTVAVDGEPRARVDLAALGGEHPFALALPQSALEEELRRALARRGVEVRFHHRLAGLHTEGQVVTAAVDRLEQVSGGYAVASTHAAVRDRVEMKARAVVGADGHHSMVRRLLGLETEAAAPARLFAAFEVLGRVDGAADDELTAAFAGATDNGLWPLPGERWRFSFELDDPDLLAGRGERRQVVQIGGRAYPAVAVRRLDELRSDRMPGVTAAADEVTWAVAVRFESRVVSSFGRDRVWLAGDAAHLAPPLGMQSMNRGLAEAVELAAALGAGRPDAGALTAYGDRALRGWRGLLGLEAGWRAGAGADPWLAENVQRVAQALPASGAHLDTLLGQLGIERA